MKKAIEAWKWVKHPHWTWRLVCWAFGLAWVAAWWLTGTAYRGFLAVFVVVAGWYIFQFGEWMVRRIRLTADAGIPLSPVRMAKDILSERTKFADANDRWALAMRAQKVVYDGQSPKLHRMQQTATGDVKASINLAGIGGNLDTITRLAADGTLAGIMHCQEVSVQPTAQLGKAWITFYKSPPLQRAFSLADLPASGKGRISFGIEEAGGPASVRYGLSMLIVSATGGGKSILFKNMFTDILRDGEPTKMYFIDPKRMELARFKALVGTRIGNIEIAGYCNTAAEAERMFKEFADEMHARQERLAELGMVELTKPTEELPARIVVVDETADIKSAFAKLDMPMPIAISQGRATLDSVICLAQIAKIETLGSVRDLVSLRAGLRMMTPENTKAALGISENDGAPCSRIPLSTPGVGFYVTDEGIVRKFRTAKVTDEQWNQVLAGKLPEGMPINVELTGPPCYVYIGPDKKGGCGYVGIADNVARRRAQHRRADSKWCTEHDRQENWWRVHIVDTRLAVKKYPSRAAALVAEERLIKELKPVWNDQHNGANPEFDLRRRAGLRRRTVDALGEYRELGRERMAAHRVQAAEAKVARVSELQERRERFVQTVTENAA